MPLVNLASDHVIWKLHLTKMIDGGGRYEGYDSVVIQQDKMCALGKWIHGEGAKYKGLPEYEDLLKNHAAFHICAAHVAKQIEDGDLVAAHETAAGPLDALSRAIVDSLFKLNRFVTGGNP